MLWVTRDQEEAFNLLYAAKKLARNVEGAKAFGRTDRTGGNPLCIITVQGLRYTEEKRLLTSLKENNANG